jgi:hypothetical protein
VRREAKTEPAEDNDNIDGPLDTRRRSEYGQRNGTSQNRRQPTCQREQQHALVVA